MADSEAKAVQYDEELDVFLYDVSNLDNDTKVESRSIAVGDGLEPDKVIDTVLNKHLDHVVQKSTRNPQLQMSSAASMIKDVKRIFEYPLATILAPENPTMEMERELIEFSYTFTSSSQKNEMLGKLREYLAEKTKSESLTTDVCLAADELFTNAVFNAPFMDDENQKGGASRFEGPVHIPYNKVAEFFAGTKDGILVIGCMDNFGTLNIRKLLSRVLDCYTRGPSSMIKADVDGGAGIGSYLVFNACMSYYLAVHEHVRTLVATTFPLGIMERKRRTMSKNVHIVNYG